MYAVHAAVIAASIWVVYRPVLDDAMTSYDDNAWMNDTAVRNSLETIFDPTLHSENLFANTYYLPLQSALFYVMVDQFGRAPRPYHVMAVLIHIAASLLLYSLVITTGAGAAPAFIASMFFAMHPGNEQSVTWVVASTSHPLVTVFVLATMIAFYRHLRSGSITAYLVALAMYVTAMLVRESAVVVPALLMGIEVLLDPLPGGPARPTFFARFCDQKNWRAALKYVPFALLALPILYFAWMKYQTGNVRNDWGGVSIGVHALVRFYDFFTLMLLPKPQEYELKMALVGFLIFASALMLFCAARTRPWLFPLAWIHLGTAPYVLSNFNPALHVTRYLYPGIVALSLLIAFMLRDASLRTGRMGWVIYALALAWPAMHAITSYQALPR